MSPFSVGDFSHLNVEQGLLVEFAPVGVPLLLRFTFNPSSITRTRSLTVNTGGAPGTQGGYDFAGLSEAPRASQGVSVAPETFSIKILLDATDRMNAGDPVAAQLGVQPEVDTIRSMIELKSQGAAGARTLSSLGLGNERAFSRTQFASVLLFKWGRQLLPVFLTQSSVELREFLPNLAPYRAEATLTMQIIESENPFYRAELKRQFASAALNLAATPGLFGGALGE